MRLSGQASAGSFTSVDHYRDHNNQIIAKAVMEKLHEGDG